MTKLIFKAADVRRILGHALGSKEWQERVIDYGNKANGWKSTTTPGTPAVILVHDQGIYLMSNGLPRDLDAGHNGPSESSFVAYAKDCHPKEDTDWYDNARDLVGGDDFADVLDWVPAIKKMLDDGASEIVVNFSSRSLSLAAKYPKGKGPKAAPCSDEDLAKYLRRLTKKQIVFFDSETKSIRLFKTHIKPTAHNIAAVVENNPTYEVLNGGAISRFLEVIALQKIAEEQKKKTLAAATV